MKAQQTYCCSNETACALIRLALAIALLAAFTPVGSAPKSVQAQSNAAICNDVSEISNAECQALMALYAATNGPAWTNRTGWDQTNTPCTWFGVGCSPSSVVSSTVTSIQLPANGLAGPLPGSFFNLPNLQVLHLHGNRLTGGLPVELGNLANLVDFRIQGNLLDGPIAFEPSRLTRLQTFYANRNQLTGTLPVFSNLPDLVNLDLSDNALTGTLAGHFVNLPNLQFLSLGNGTIAGRNQLTGPIPPEIGSLANLRVLWLFGNRLTGGLPVELGNLANLVDFQIQRNLLDGPIEFEPSRLTRLQTFYANRNQLTGTLPVFSNLPDLVNLDLSDNALTGTLVGRFVSLPNLKFLSLQINQLTGSIPIELGDLLSLEALILNNNQLTGAIPRTLGNLTNLRRLDLHVNSLSGSIPQELGNARALQGFHLHRNLLEGGLPETLNQLTNLVELEVYANRLTGPIPDLSNLKRLTWLRLDSNHLTGTIPSTLGALTNLRGLYLAGNRLTGQIPRELGELVNLRFLSLDYNALEGSIPPEIANIGSVVRTISPSLAIEYSLNYNNLSLDVTPEVNWLLRRYNPMRGTFTWQETQTRPPENVRARQINSDLLVTWDPLPLQLTNYQVRCDGPQMLTHTTPDRNTVTYRFTNIAPGTYSCTVRTFVEVQNTTQQNPLLSAPSAPAIVTIGTPPEHKVFVQNSSGQPVIGASVVVSRAGNEVERAISTAPLGEVAFNQPVQWGDALIAISQTVPISTPKRPRQPDGAGRAYITSLDITPAGAVPYVVAITGTHVLTVNRANPLLLFDLVVSMQWSTYDADPARRYEVLRELERAFRSASTHLYDVSDGRMALGTVKIYDDGQSWQNADIHVFANASLIPNAEVSGTKRIDAYVSIRRGWDRRQADVALYENDGYKMLVHELGHYLLGLRDSYEGTSTIMCTTLMAWPYDGDESKIFSMQGLAPWIVDSAEAERCKKTEQWLSLGVSDWETIVSNFTQLTIPAQHITSTMIASPLSAAAVITYPSGRQIQPSPVRLIQIAPTTFNAIGQPLYGTIVKANGQVIDLGPVDRSGNFTVTVPFEPSDQLLVTSPDGAASQLFSANELSGTIAISVSDALANPTIDVSVGDEARAITVTIGNANALDGANTLTATVIEAGNEDPVTMAMTLTRQGELFIGGLTFSGRIIKQGNILVAARTLGGGPVLLVSSFTTDGDGGSHMRGRAPRSPDGKFEMRIPFEAAQLLQNTALIVSPIRITSAPTSVVAAMSGQVIGASNPYPPPPLDLRQIGSLYNIRASQGLVSIAEPMSVTLYYDPATLGNLSETQIKIYYLDEQQGLWQELSTTLNLRSTVETHSVSASTNRFGIYGLFIKTRYRLVGGSDGPRQNEFVFVGKEPGRLPDALGECVGQQYSALYSEDRFDPINPWRKYFPNADPAYLNTLDELRPGNTYQIMMNSGADCTLDFGSTLGLPPPPSNPDTLPILPSTIYGSVRADAVEIIGRCSDNPKLEVRVKPTRSNKGLPVFNIDLPVNSREAVTCVLEAKSEKVMITKTIKGQSNTVQWLDMSAYNWFFPFVDSKRR